MFTALIKPVCGSSCTLSAHVSSSTNASKHTNDGLDGKRTLLVHQSAARVKYFDCINLRGLQVAQPAALQSLDPTTGLIGLILRMI